MLKNPKISLDLPWKGHQSLQILLWFKTFPWEATKAGEKRLGGPKSHFCFDAFRHRTESLIQKKTVGEWRDPEISWFVKWNPQIIGYWVVLSPMPISNYQPVGFEIVGSGPKCLRIDLDWNLQWDSFYNLVPHSSCIIRKRKCNFQNHLLTPQPSTCHAPTFGISKMIQTFGGKFMHVVSLIHDFLEHTTSPVGTSVLRLASFINSKRRISAAVWLNEKKMLGINAVYPSKWWFLIHLSIPKPGINLSCCDFLFAQIAALSPSSVIEQSSRANNVLFFGAFCWETRSKKLIQHPWQKKNRRSKKKKWLSHLPWSLVKKGLPMPQDRRRYVESCRSLRCIDNEMRLYLKKKKLRIKKTGGLKPARNLTQHNLPYVSQLKWAIWEDSSRIDFCLNSSKNWNHPILFGSKCWISRFRQCFKDISPAHLSIPPILPAAFSLVADVRLGLPPERARSPGKGGPGLAQAVSTLVNNDSRSDDMMSIRSHEIWHQPKLHALFFQGNLSKYHQIHLLLVSGSPKRVPFHDPPGTPRPGCRDLLLLTFVRFCRGGAPKNSRRFGQKTQIAKPQPLEISVKIGHLQRFFIEFFKASPRYISIIPGLWFNNSCRTSFYIKPGLLFLFPPQSSQWFGQFLLGKNQQMFKHGKVSSPAAAVIFVRLRQAFLCSFQWFFHHKSLVPWCIPLGLERSEKLCCKCHHDTIWIRSLHHHPIEHFRYPWRSKMKQTKPRTLPWSWFWESLVTSTKVPPKSFAVPSIFAEDLVVESGPGKVGPA